jgi:septum formation protein
MGVPIVLASTSKWRRKLLADVGIAVACADPGDAEARADTPPGRGAEGLALARARAKAERLHREGQFTVGADQVIDVDGELLGKPADADAHVAQLQRLRGTTQALHTGLVVLGPGPDARAERVVTTRVRVRADIDDGEIRAYVASGDATGCAGGYRVESHGALLIASVEGDWNNVVGLPVFALVDILRAAGWRPTPG